jgi:DNA-directed RNA polymerase specialized sigma subunit
MPLGGTPISLDELISDKMELEDRITRLKKKSRVIKAEILNVIDSLEDTRYCEVLESYFIERLSIEEIAYKTGYTVRYVYTLYSDAISRITVNEQ